MTPAGLVLIYCVLTALASLFGGWIPSLIRLTHVRQQLMMSLVSGVMLGVALVQMLPHSLEHLSPSWVGACMLSGVLVMFFLLRIFHVHAHDTVGKSESHNHNHSHQDHDHHHSEGQHRFSWAGLFVGLAIHSLLDGMAMAASVAAEASFDHPRSLLLGLGTFLAVLLHKPLDALAITSLMRTSQWSSRSRTAVNVLFALWCPLGAILFWLGVSQISSGHSAWVGCTMAFSAGFFLCIALSDLLPEVAFHSHDRVKLSAALLLGVALSLAIELGHAQYHHDNHDSHTTHDHAHEP